MSIDVSAPHVGSPTDAVVRLDDVSWETYRQLRDSPQNEAVRMAYDQGTLYLMSPSKRHERVSELLSQLVVEWALAKSIEFQSCGSVILRRDDLEKGLEPDKCFYLQHEAAVRDQDELDLSIDPPPDLVIEVEVTYLSERKLTIFAAIGVPEVWRWRNETLQVLRLERNRYIEVRQSRALPGFPISRATALIQRRRRLGNMSLLREFRNSIQESDTE